MKKIYLILPLVVLLIAILITSVCILLSMRPSEQVHVGESASLIEDGEPLAAVNEDLVDVIPFVDMSGYEALHGIPAPHGSVNDPVYGFGLEPSVSDNGSRFEYEVSKISFLAVGDNLIHSSIYADASDEAGGNGYLFEHMYENVAEPIRNADLSFINQESPLAGNEFSPSGYPMFNTPNEMGDILLSLGFDIISIANNHMLDKYEKGYKNHIEYWSEKPVTLIGGYTDKDDYDNVRVVEKNGISIALLAYTYGTNGMTLPSSSQMVVPLIDENDIKRQIGIAKQKADLVFVSIHWGDENAFSPNSRQRQLARLMADNCVDVILGHHSHTIQPIEWYERPDGKKTLVAFSLGNFMSGQEYARNMLAGMLTFDVEKLDSAETYISNVLFTPTVTHYNYSWRKFKLYYLKDYTAELYKTARCSQFEPDFNYYTSKIKSTVSAEFLPDYLK
ncbi:MAG: CapA family protein [Ruminococcaceae bacterium]|nr:CapA family protein [Oscillospiraceae bacterium]